jgi:hypothetical protein
MKLFKIAIAAAISSLAGAYDAGSADESRTAASGGSYTYTTTSYSYEAPSSYDSNYDNYQYSSYNPSYYKSERSYYDYRERDSDYVNNRDTPYFYSDLKRVGETIIPDAKTGEYWARHLIGIFGMIFALNLFSVKW